MNDLIYRNDAIDALAYFDGKSPTGKTAQDIIISLPSAQPEIIRCKDCEYWDGSWNYCRYHGCFMFEEDGCNSAERRMRNDIPVES